jgi:alkylation response protein AidB-like acyl-CoA dehydrogenase
MDFSFTVEQDELRRAVRDLARDRASSAQVRAVIDGPTGHDPELWKLVAGELGLTGLTVAEERGGVGGSFVDAAVALEEAGRCLLPLPLLPSVVAATVLDRVGCDAVTDVASGTRIATLAVGEVTGDGALRGKLRHVIDGGIADLVVVAAPTGLWLVETTASGVTVDGRPTLDPTRRQASLRLEGAAATRIGDAVAADRAVDLLRVALSVEAIGVARWCLETTVDYLKTRVQFGRPIGSFQALQHRAADLAVRLESAASTAYYAAWTAADSPDELPVLAPLAMSVCAAAAYEIAAETIQMHGGIGFTWEHDAHLYFKRATSTRLLLGDSHEQRRLAAARADLIRQ